MFFVKAKGHKKNSTGTIAKTKTFEWIFEIN